MSVEEETELNLATPKTGGAIGPTSTVAKTGHQPRNIDPLMSPIGFGGKKTEVDPFELSESENEDENTTTRASLQSLTVQKLKIKLSDHGISAKGLKKAAMVDKLYGAEQNSKSTVVKAPPPRARAPIGQHSRLMKSASDSNICTPPRKNNKRNNQHMTPRENQKKKVSVEKDETAGSSRVGRAKKPL